MQDRKDLTKQHIDIFATKDRAADITIRLATFHDMLGV